MLIYAVSKFIVKLIIFQYQLCEMAFTLKARSRNICAHLGTTVQLITDVVSFFVLIMANSRNY